MTSRSSGRASPPAPRPQPWRMRCAAVAALLAAASLAACEQGGGLQDITAAAPASAIKFFNFGVGAPAVNFFANDTKVTAVSSTACTPLPAPPADSTCRGAGVESATGTASGAAGVNGLYVGLATGTYTFTGRIAAVTDRGLAVATVQQPLEGGKRYSLFMSGPYDAAAKRSDAFVLEDVLPAEPAGDSTYIRFVNASHNAPSVALAIRTTAGVWFQATPTSAYKAGTTFIRYFGGGVVDIGVVNAAAPTTPIFTRTGATFNPGRVYTVTLRGDWTVSPTGTSANRPQLDVTANW